MLNQAQQTAVGHTSGPLLVVAGAGTGKTRVIVERINKLLDSGVAARNIVALTFTEKAASEMLERVLESRSGYEPELGIMTFNGFGENLLREFNTDIGLSRNFLLMGDNAKIVFLRQNLRELELNYYSPVSNPEGLLPDLADYFSKLKQHVITPQMYATFVKTIKATDDAAALEKRRHEELARAYGNYLRLSAEQNVIDYDDQIYRAIELLEGRPNILEKLQERYQHIMIDEFQDTNTMQSRLVDLLYGNSPKGSLVVVGDDDQSIYGFRGATLTNILSFKERYPDTKEVTLTDNYRSGQAILNSAYTLIQHNNPERLEAKLGIYKQLLAHTDGEDPRVQQFATIDGELQWIAEDITERLKSGEKPGDIAVLCRRRKTAQLLEQYLAQADVPHVVVGEQYDLYQSEVVRMLVECLKAVVDPSASTSLYHTLTSPLFGADVADLAVQSSQANREHRSLEDVLTTAGEQDKALAMLKSWRSLSTTIPVGRLVYKMIEETGFKDMLYKQAMKDQDSARSIMQLSQFFKTLKEFESIALQPTALQYIESYRVLESAGESGEDTTLQMKDNLVSIVTVHKSKGLEWETVYIPDCTEGSFPTRRQSTGIKLPEGLLAGSETAADEHYAEERRLMYVAMTRAKHNLLLSCSGTHNGNTLRKPSRFVAEALPDTQLTEPTLNDTQEVPLLDAGAGTNNQTSVPIPAKLFDGKRANLSVSQITTFLNCPLDFYYRFVLNVPEEESSAAHYGSAVHSVIEEINKSRMTGEALSKQQALELLDSIWQSGGYISNDHRKRSLEQARTTIERFYDEAQTRPAPTLIEHPFTVDLQEEGMLVRGRFDAVFESEAAVEIRDYKTSTTVDTAEKAKRRASGSDQLTLYALVWQELRGEMPTVLSLEFVDTNLVGSVKKTQRGIDSMRAKLGQITQALMQHDFQPGANHDYCRHPKIS